MNKYIRKNSLLLVLIELVFLMFVSMYYFYSQKDQYLKKADLPLATFSISSDDLSASNSYIEYTCWFSYYDLFENGIDINKFKTEYNVVVIIEKLGVNKMYTFEGKGILINFFIERNQLTDLQRETFDQIILDKEIEVSFILSSKYTNKQIGIIDKSILWKS